MGPESLGELLNTKDFLLLKLNLDGRLARNYVRCRMQSSTLRKRNPFVLICWSLVLALLLGQSYALAHDHDADHASETSCALCLYAQLSDAFRTVLLVRRWSFIRPTTVRSTHFILSLPRTTQYLLIRKVTTQ